MTSVKINVDQVTRKKFDQELTNFTKKLGKTFEDGLDQLAENVGKKLIHSVQPYGTNAKVGQKFEMSIAKQVSRAIRHANVAGQDGTAPVVHKENRNSKGQVPKGLRVEGKFNRKPIEISDRNALIAKKMASAGIAKGAWFAATNQISGKKIGGVAKWITRHENKGLGSCDKTGNDLKRRIRLTNSAPYIESVQSVDDVEKAIKTSYKQFIKYIQITLAKMNK
jgi:hypothetical protein